MNGFIYLLKRDKSAVKILSRAKVIKKTLDPNPYSMIEDPVIAKGVDQTIKKNIMQWQSYAEPGTIEEILFNLKKIGIKLPVGKYAPVVKEAIGNTPIIKRHQVGKLNS